MTMHPNPNRIVAHSTIPSTIVAAGSAVRTSSSSTASKDKSVSIIKEESPTPAASVEISDLGRQLAAQNKNKVTNQTEAKAQVIEVARQIKEHPEKVVNLHSNLRAMKINHLIYD